MRQRVRTTSPRPRRAFLGLEWLEDRRVPALLGLLSGVVSQVPLLSAPAAPAALAGHGSAASTGVSAKAGGALPGANLAAGVSVAPSAGLTLNVGATLGGAPPSPTESSAPVAAGLVVTAAVPGGQTEAVAVPAPLLPGLLPVPAVQSEGASLPSGAPVAAAGITLAGQGDPLARQPVTAPPLPVPAGPAGPTVQSLGTAAVTGAAAGALLAPASNLLPAVVSLLPAPAPLPGRDDGGAGAAPPPGPAGIAPALLTPAAPARVESGAVEAEEQTAPAPEPSGPATDLTPEGLSAEAPDAAMETEFAALGVGAWPDYWRLAPWVAGLAAALAGAELARRRRRAAAEAERAGAFPAAEVLWGLPGLWSGEEG